MARRTIAIGAGLLVLILIVLGFRGCLSAREERATKDYVGDTNELIGESKSEAEQLFELLGGTGEPVDVQNIANGLRTSAAQLVDRAEDLDPPDDMSDANGYFLEAMELRRDGIAEIAKALPAALADQERRESTDRIAEMMRVFDASDVLLLYRFRQSRDSALASNDLEGDVVVARDAQMRFLPDVEWLDPAFVADQVEGLRTGTGGDAGGDGEAAPGLHGNGLGTVTLGGVALVPGASATVPLTDDLAFDVQVVNQGENTETDVTVKVSIGEGDDLTEIEEQIPEIGVGTEQTVTVPLGERPPVGEQVPITVEVVPVDGEEKTDNNSADFSVIFTS